MNCPNCSSETWDNSEKVKAGWRGPLRKCKDTACGWVQWPPRDKAAKPSNGAPAKASGPKWTWAQLQDLSAKCLKIAAKQVPQAVGAITSEDTIKWAATLFITAARDGVAPAFESLDKKPAAVEAAEKEADDDLPW